jgi:HEPN domain-containing protein
MANSKTVPELMLDSARQDLAACVLLATGLGIGDAVIGFHAQQAAEKSIKAVLSAHTIEFRRTHDLVTLLDLLEEHGLEAPPASDWLDELNPYAVEARYGMIDPGFLDRKRALDVVAQVIAWAMVQSSSRRGIS